jgi:CheY-like chemotaxis protein
MTRPFQLLVAEDNEDDLYLLQQASRKAGMTAQLQRVADGLETIAYLNGEGRYADRTAHPFPDALLLDLNMPRRNGFEVLEWIRAQPSLRRLIVHVFTASARQADAVRAYELGANSYVVKPIRLDELVAFVSAFDHWHRFTVIPAPPTRKTDGSAAASVVPTWP